MPEMIDHESVCCSPGRDTRRAARVSLWVLLAVVGLSLVVIGGWTVAQGQDDYGYGDDPAAGYGDEGDAGYGEAGSAEGAADQGASEGAAGGAGAVKMQAKAAAPGRYAATRFEEPTFDVVSPGDYADYNQRQRLMVRGEQVYNIHCVGCHGAKGDGNGPAAVRLIVKPRDFTSGIYKFRSTVAGTLPLDADLHRTITRGLSRVSMPAFPLISERDKVALVEYVKSFYPPWEAEAAQREKVFVPLSPPDLMSDERVGRGNVVYVAMGCGKCHGVDGAGTGATETSYTDAWGNQQAAFNFTRGQLKNGDTPEDIYRTFHTGLNSIMPQYGGTTLALVSPESLEGKLDLVPEAQRRQIEQYKDQFPATTAAVFEQSQGEQEALAMRNSWDLVAFVLSLRQERAYGPILGGAGLVQNGSGTGATTSDE